ncbi:hypothetical protein WR164_04490 [Philodulcilactobacillus myokoensis]|uniref:DUF3021 domain-containing protein n=1 Tax=Philodulcilactobacillus myokoensis TaxID=2929573 RepID=A0A9W6B0W4_9LACO|nr:DUF3021 family protein [Philodulcilactobacillus myokoensis]GLB46470.1 hypothetical protein WR164_04490 [Philodulcilactobacillus myokoensis]
MNKLIYGLIRFGLLGMMIGALVYFVMAILNNRLVITKSFAIQYLAICMFIGLISKIFTIERLKIWQRLLIHSILTFLTFFIFNVVVFSFPANNFKLDLIFLVNFIAIYFMIGIWIYFIDLNNMKRINKQIAKRKKIKEEKNK